MENHLNGKQNNELLMNKNNLKKLSKSQLIEKLLKLDERLTTKLEKPKVVIIDDTKDKKPRKRI